MVKNVLKFSVGAVVIVVLGIGAISGTQYLKYRYSDEYKAKKEIDKFIKEYENDPYGGNTPEETLQLFIDALKKGDVDLASKYFVMEKQEEQLTDLQSIHRDNLLKEMVNDLLRQKDKKIINDAIVTFYIYNDNKQLALAIRMTRIPNGKWKIADL